MTTTSQIALSSIIRRRSGLSAQDIDDTLVVADQTTTWCYGMECIARQIWHLLDCPRTVSDLCTALMDGYEIDRQRCESDVLDFVGELNREGLIEIIQI